MFLRVLVGFLGFVLSLAIAAGLIVWLRKPLKDLLLRLVEDETIAAAGALFVAILIGLYGLSTAFTFIREAHVTQLFGTLFTMLDQMAGVIQWVIYIAALLFIGWSIRGKGAAGE